MDSYVIEYGDTVLGDELWKSKSGGCSKIKQRELEKINKGTRRAKFDQIPAAGRYKMLGSWFWWMHSLGGALVIDGCDCRNKAGSEY